MEHIESVGTKEFKQNLAKYTSNPTPLAITSHGKPIGYFIPAVNSFSKNEYASIRKKQEKLAALLSKKKISEDDLIKEFSKLRKGDK